MQTSPGAPMLSTKGLLGLVYVGIALTLITNAAALTETNTQWLRAASQLDLNVQTVSFNLGTSSDIPNATVTASLENPSGFAGLTLEVVTYEVFVNSTSQPFDVQGSSQVVSFDVTWGKTIPAGASLNLTATVRMITDVVVSLRNFLVDHQNRDLVTFVGIILTLQSPYIGLSVPFCTELPGQTAAICPNVRAPTGGGGGA